MHSAAQRRAQIDATVDDLAARIRRVYLEVSVAVQRARKVGSQAAADRPPPAAHVFDAFGGNGASHRLRISHYPQAGEGSTWSQEALLDFQLKAHFLLKQTHRDAHGPGGPNRRLIDDQKIVDVY